MKHLSLIAAVLLVSSNVVNAQDGKIAKAYKDEMKNYPIRFGIKTGLGIANMTVDNAGSVRDKKAIPAWQVGLYVDIPLLPVFSLQSGILLAAKGSKFTIGDNESPNYTDVSTRPLYVEVPLNAVIKIPLPNKVRLFAGAGPYLAVGVGGKTWTEGKLLGISFSEDKSIQYNSNNNSTTYNNDLKRFDAGLNFLAGLEISHFTLNANYGYGLMNIKSGSDNNNTKYANRVISLSIGVLF